MPACVMYQGTLPSVVQYEPANKKHLIWASLICLLGRHVQTNLEHRLLLYRI